VCQIEQTGRADIGSIAPEKTGRHVQGFLQQTMSDDYREELADERAETERLFILKVLAKREAERRHRSERVWVVVKGRAENDVELRP
jgi:mannose-6-phosphate isomerase-like protein (cupin superfamily)